MSIAAFRCRLAEIVRRVGELAGSRTASADALGRMGPAIPDWRLPAALAVTIRVGIRNVRKSSLRKPQQVTPAAQDFVKGLELMLIFLTFRYGDRLKSSRNRVLVMP